MIVDLVALCVSLAENAGVAIREISTEDDLQIVNKGDSEIGEYDPQTEADRVAETIIITNLRKIYPNCTIIGEETASTGETTISKSHEKFINQPMIPSRDVLEKCSQQLTTTTINYDTITQEDLIIWLDPLDGTFDFASGIRKHVTVLIGIALKTGEPIAGVIHQPFYNHNKTASKTTNEGRTIWGVVGVGAFNINDLSAEKSGSFVIATSKIHVDGIVLDTIKQLGADQVLHTPGAGFKAIELMEKHVDAIVYPGKGTSKWDICATDAVCRSMIPPLVVTDFFGRPFNYSAGTSIKNTNGIIVATDFHYKSIIEKIPQKTLDYLK